MTITAKRLGRFPFSHKLLTDVLWCVTVGLDEAHVQFLCASTTTERKKWLKNYRELLQFGEMLLIAWGPYWFREEDVQEFRSSLSARARTYRARTLEVGHDTIRKEMLKEVGEIERSVSEIEGLLL
ncbi:MAG: hypothetical protein WDZ90_02435 [Candidatus Paceibacterota bacterium]